MSGLRPLIKFLPNYAENFPRIMIYSMKSNLSGIFNENVIFNIIKKAKKCKFSPSVNINWISYKISEGNKTFRGLALLDSNMIKKKIILLMNKEFFK